MKKILFGLCIFLAATLSFAKSINLYVEPKPDSKVLGTLDSQVGAITIYTPKDNPGWVKVADPRDGKVGWIKSTEFGNTNFTFQVITSGDNANGYRIYQYGGTESYSPQKVEDEMKKMQLRQQNIQRRMQHLMDDMFDDFYVPGPIFVPVIIMPEKTGAPKPAAAKPAATKTSVEKPATAPTVKQ